MHLNVTFGREDVPYAVIDNVKGFDPDKIFDCGQCFRFTKTENSSHASEWAGVAYGRFISVAADKERVIIYNTDEKDYYEIWERYLSLDTDYEAIDEDILSRSDSADLRSAVKYGNGIRILRQDPWEALCSFIISQNNNIPRIRSLIGALCRAGGTPVNTKGMERHGAVGEYYSFPDAKTVTELGEEALKEMKMGFRAGYIATTAAEVASGGCDFEKISSAVTTSDASLMLQSLRGVGPKVAACALLFGFDRMDSFPVDVWIKKVIAKYFPGDFKPDILGPFAGMAQQYLFYYERWLGGSD